MNRRDFLRKTAFLFGAGLLPIVRRYYPAVTVRIGHKTMPDIRVRNLDGVMWTQTLDTMTFVLPVWFEEAGHKPPAGGQ